LLDLNFVQIDCSSKFAYLISSLRGFLLDLNFVQIDCSSKFAYLISSLRGCISQHALSRQK
ncbi:MAG: hypothetical protein WCF96_06425, partial [Eubacteriales bacterium]